MPDKHAILSSSSSYRWMHCTKAPLLEAKEPGTESEAAAEGTAAHALAEYKIKRMLKMQAERPVSQYDTEEMENCTDDYASFVFEHYKKMKKKDPTTELYVEEQLSFEPYVPQSFGTSDAIIVSKTKIHVCDLKYGLQVVDSFGNSQLLMYALGAYLKFGCGGNIKKIEMTIFQPRRENIQTSEITVKELLKWAETELKPKAELAFNNKGKFQAGPWCQFCRIATKCRARAREKLILAQEEFDAPDTLSDDEIEDILPKIAELKKWCDEIWEYAQNQALNGKEWTGFKMVEGRSIRTFTNESDVIKAANAAGYKDIYKKSLLSIPEFEKLMGKQEFQEILGAYVQKPKGKPTLVPESDKRPGLNLTDPKNEFRN